MGMAKKLAGECFGTFALVGIALTFGLIVLAMVYTLGDTSGAHINPAVTIGFWAARRFDADKVLPYIVSQCAGAFLASAILRMLLPVNLTLGATIPAGPVLQSFILELILTALLMFAILGVSTGAREKGITAGIVVGSVIGSEAMFAGPICGASMNLARSLAPAVVSQHFFSLWIYLVAPPTGALLAILGCRCVRERGCCAIPYRASRSETFMDERPQPQRGRSSTRLLVTAAPRGAWWTWRTTFALWSNWCAKRSEREHPHSKKHEHLLHSSTSFLVRLLRTNIAASVFSKFEERSDATLLKANIAGSVLSKFKALSHAIGIAAHSPVAPGIREMAQAGFD